MTLEDVPFDRAARWPAAVSHAEASAYARWRGARLPAEAEWHRAARATPGGGLRRWPWGDEPPAGRANVDFRHGSSIPAGSDPSGASAWGVLELVGNGWEWTATPFAPFPGFEPLAGYPGYSADFFDDAHFVLLGGSWATDEALLRPSFRNWFQPHYPYVFSKLRCAARSDPADPVREVRGSADRVEREPGPSLVADLGHGVLDTAMVEAGRLCI